MEVRSSYRYARISAFKAREVTREIQGLPALDAVDILKFTAKKAAPLILKTLKSAIANAENNNNLNSETLVVKEAVVGEGPTIKRSIPKARGSSGPILKRMSHIHILLTDEIEIVRRTKTKSKSGASKNRSRKSSKSPINQEINIDSTSAVVETPATNESSSKQ